MAVKVKRLGSVVCDDDMVEVMGDDCDGVLGAGATVIEENKV